MLTKIAYENKFDFILSFVIEIAYT